MMDYICLNLSRFAQFSLLVICLWGDIVKFGVSAFGQKVFSSVYSLLIMWDCLENQLNDLNLGPYS